MAGIKNNTERQYNLKCIGKNGNRVTVRLVPGINNVDDKHWGEFVRKEGKKTVIDPFVKELAETGKIEEIEDFDDLDDDTPKARSKSVKTPKTENSSKKDKN